MGPAVNKKIEFKILKTTLKNCKKFCFLKKQNIQKKAVEI